MIKLYLVINMSNELKKEDYEEPKCLLKMNSDNELPEIIRIIQKLDYYYQKNDLVNALALLDFWYNEAIKKHDLELLLSILNERMGYFRKAGLKKEAINCTNEATKVLYELNDFDSTYVGTTYLNIATVYKAFGKSKEALPLYKKAEHIFNKNLLSNDPLKAGLYNNMALALVDLDNFDDALYYYNQAISILKNSSKNNLDIAITYLNMANLYEKRDGIMKSTPIIDSLLEKAIALLDQKDDENNGYYAFVCEKCAPTFSYYGYFLYASILKERANKIYERNRNI